jgi:hypothetical protein
MCDFSGSQCLSALRSQISVRSPLQQHAFGIQANADFRGDAVDRLIYDVMSVTLESAAKGMDCKAP